jgi:hypothetical protein
MAIFAAKLPGAIPQWRLWATDHIKEAARAARDRAYSPEARAKRAGFRHVLSQNLEQLRANVEIIIDKGSHQNAVLRLSPDSKITLVLVQSLTS